jgi:hypothetical protein
MPVGPHPSVVDGDLTTRPIGRQGDSDQGEHLLHARSHIMLVRRAPRYTCYTPASELWDELTSEGYRPPFNATCVQSLLDNGAHITGQTKMDEFGMG